MAFEHNLAIATEHILPAFCGAAMWIYYSLLNTVILLSCLSEERRGAGQRERRGIAGPYFGEMRTGTGQTARCRRPAASPSIETPSLKQIWDVASQGRVFDWQREKRTHLTVKQELPCYFLWFPPLALLLENKTSASPKSLASPGNWQIFAVITLQFSERKFAVSELLVTANKGAYANPLIKKSGKVRFNDINRRGKRRAYSITENCILKKSL